MRRGGGRPNGSLQGFPLLPFRLKAQVCWECGKRSLLYQEPEYVAEQHRNMRKVAFCVSNLSFPKGHFQKSIFITKCSWKHLFLTLYNITLGYLKTVLLTIFHFVGLNQNESFHSCVSNQINPRNFYNQFNNIKLSFFATHFVRSKDGVRFLDTILKYGNNTEIKYCWVEPIGRWFENCCNVGKV